MTRRNPGSNGMLGSDGEDSSDSIYEGAGSTAAIGSAILQRMLRGNSFQEYNPTPPSLGVSGPKMGSVLSGNMSPVQRIRFGNSTVDKTVEDEALLSHQSMSGRKKTQEDNEKERIFGQTYEHFSGGKDESSPGDFHCLPPLPSSQIKVRYVSKDRSLEDAQFDERDDDLRQRIQEVADFAASTGVERNVYETKLAAGESNFPAYSPPTQHESLTTLGDTGGVPERFREGRESLSVIRNVTVRESKRPKARASDSDYQRRCSMSPSALKASLGHQGPTHTSGTGVDRSVSNSSRTPFVKSVQKPPGSDTSIISSDPGNGNYEINLS